MRDQRYSFEIGHFNMSYEFVSEGPKGRIVKQVKYTEIEDNGFYNLGFGDKIDNEDDFDDEVISDNNDSIRILATIAAAVYHFTEHKPNAYVFAQGNIKARTRLYRIELSNHLEEIKIDFIILGYINNSWENYQKNRDYSAFLITRK